MTTLDSLTYTSLEEIPRICEQLNKEFKEGTTLPIPHRKKQLRSVAYMFQDNQELFCEALAKDQERPAFETVVHEIHFVIKEIHTALTNLDRWTAGKKVKTEFPWNFANPKVHREPKGRVLIIGAWNSLLVGPLIGAIAAGCTVALKPSENSPHTAALLGKLLFRYLYDPQTVKVINGAVDETTALLNVEGGWDHITYTGSTNVGRIIASSAAKNLTPTTLELGGKSPTIICEDADLKLAAHRIFLTRIINSGQMCIAPDYLICPASIQPALIKEFKEFLIKAYPEPWLGDEAAGKASRMVNERQYERVKGIIAATKGEILIGGGSSDDKLKIEPTVVRANSDDSVMADEIFGPVLGLITKDTLDEAINFINSRPHPLAIYVYTKDAKKVDYVRTHTRSGAIVGNASAVHFSVPGLPFGGIGESGMGNWHGEYSFNAFSYERSTLNVPSWFQFIVGKITPPYNEKNLKFLSSTIPKITRKTGEPSLLSKIAGKFWLITLVAAIAVASKRREQIMTLARSITN
ncbi:aldehyde dehydrogenase [Atractiella rhizophila]|nr:aldehyde dehydrogenase [Atractiella rhizophila]